jgi:hypothetical protein
MAAKQDIMSEEEFQKISSVNWKNQHSRRLQQATGDDLLVIGFCPWVTYAVDGVPHSGYWALARLVKRRVMRTYDSMNITEAVEEVVPVVWKHWKDDETNKPLSPVDTRLVEYIRWCDSQNPDQVLIRNIYAAQEEREAQRAAAKREAYARATDLFKEKATQEWYDSWMGSSAPREGSGGDRKFFYDGCLSKDRLGSYKAPVVAA